MDAEPMGTPPMGQSAAPGRSGVALALMAATLWGVAGAVAGGLFDRLDPLRVAQGRATVAALVLLPVAWVRRPRPPRSVWVRLAVLGVVLAVVNGTYYVALDRLGVGPGATVQFIGPLFLLAWAALRGEATADRAVWVLGVTAVVGVALVTGALDGGAVDAVGVAAGIAAAVTFATYLGIGASLGRELDPIVTIAYGFAAAALLWAVVLPAWSFPVSDLGAGGWAGLLWVGVAGTAAPFLIQFTALQRLAAGLVGIVATAEPVVAAVAAWLFLDQRLTATQIIGGVIVVVVVAVVQRRAHVIEEPYEAAR